MKSFPPYYKEICDYKVVHKKTPWIVRSRKSLMSAAAAALVLQRRREAVVEYQTVPYTTAPSNEHAK